jgi:hypothetical protein
VFAATIVVSLISAVLLAVSAAGKFARQEMQMATLRHVGFPEDKAWLLACAELAGSGGLAIGLAWWPLGVAAGIGVIAYFAGAVGSHARARDPKVGGALLMLALAAAALALRAASA